VHSTRLRYPTRCQSPRSATTGGTRDARSASASDKASGSDAGTFVSCDRSSCVAKNASAAPIAAPMGSQNGRIREKAVKEDGDSSWFHDSPRLCVGIVRGDAKWLYGFRAVERRILTFASWSIRGEPRPTLPVDANIRVSKQRTLNARRDRWLNVD
jgi:hypothetical protein